MMVLITYDVCTESAIGKKRLHKVAKECQNYGQRVQNSVFECVVNSANFAILKHKLEKIIDVNTDSIRYYYLGNNYISKIEHHGVKKSYNPEGILIV
ncbi:CRISPR-associated endonuclease Cas2 [bacterium]|jgi:CRISPR-associated protein Cas2|nr:CRISPR-associated endonuclease Cas2 [bacterium]